uniref:Uncharacterized protein n=1 Tax=Oryza barthii TaxID=65489 RepID=A0A0D3FJX5_9ORYZ
MAWSPWSKGNTESNPIRAQHHGVQIKGDFANNKTCSKHELDPGDEIDWTLWPKGPRHGDLAQPRHDTAQLLSSSCRPNPTVVKWVGFFLSARASTCGSQLRNNTVCLAEGRAGTTCLAT